MGNSQTNERLQMLQQYTKRETDKDQEIIGPLG